MPFLKPWCLRDVFDATRKILPIISNLAGTLVVTVALSGCGAVRIGYDSAPSLSYWYLDAYFDFDSEQTLRVKADLQNAHVWHRKEELPRLAIVATALKTLALQDVTGEPICQASAELQQRVVATLEQMAPTLAAIAPTLTDEQLQHLAAKAEKSQTAWREDYVDGTVAERLERRVQRSVKSTESFYGRLRAEQVAFIKKQIRASAYDPEAMVREKLRRTEDMLQVLRQIRSAPDASTQSQAAVLALLHRSVVSPDPVYRLNQARLTQQGCAAMAQLHNSMSAQQRRNLQETLQDYEADIRTLMSPRP